MTGSIKWYSIYSIKSLSVYILPQPYGLTLTFLGVILFEPVMLFLSMNQQSNTHYYQNYLRFLCALMLFWNLQNQCHSVLFLRPMFFFNINFSSYIITMFIHHTMLWMLFQCLLSFQSWPILYQKYYHQPSNIFFLYIFPSIFPTDSWQCRLSILIDFPRLYLVKQITISL